MLRASSLGVCAPRRRARAPPVPRRRAMAETTGARRCKPAREISCVLEHFTKSADAQAAARARPAGSRQNVICAAGVVSDRLRAPRAEKYASRFGQFLDQVLASQPGMLKCSGATRLAKRIAASSDARNQNGARRAQRLPRRIRLRQFAQLLRRLPSRTAFAKRARCRHQQRNGVGIVLGLRQHIRGDVARRSPPVARISTSVGPGGHVDRAIIRNQTLRRSDVAIARDRKSCPRAESIACRRRTRRSPARRPCAQFPSTPRISAAASSAATRFRTRHDDALHAGHLRRNRRHQQRREKRKSPAGNVAADGFERRDALADAHARLDRNASTSAGAAARRRGECFARHARCARSNSREHVAARGAEFRAADPQRLAASSAHVRRVAAPSETARRRRSRATSAENARGDALRAHASCDAARAKNFSRHRIG